MQFAVQSAECIGSVLCGVALLVLSARSEIEVVHLLHFRVDPQERKELRERGQWLKLVSW